MKIEKIDANKTIVFLNKFYVCNDMLFNIKKLEDYFRKIFRILNDKHNLGISGYYKITIYKDSIYGIILELDKDDIDYLDFDNQVDMRIIISDYEGFLFKLEDFSLISNSTINQCHIYKYKDKLYLKPKRGINYIELGNVIENSEIIFGKDLKFILDSAIKVNSKYLFV